MTFFAGQILADVFFPAIPEGPKSALPGLAPLVRPMGHTVHNLTIEGTHTYIAGGIRVHNTSVLSFLNEQQLAMIVPGSLADQNNDGSLDYVELDNNLGGLAAAGATFYKMETVNGVLVVKAFVTHADAYGRLVQTQYLVGENKAIIDGSVQQIVLRGADFGYQLGAIVTPYLTAAILDDDASPFERFAVNSIAGTFIQNLFEFAGGAIHDQIASGGLQNGTLDDIAAITFADFGDELIGNAVDNAADLMTRWIMAEVFEGLNTDTFGGKFAALLAQQGADWIVDVTIHSIALDVLDLDPGQIARWGLTAPQFEQVFSGANLVNLLFKAAIGTILPALDSTEAQIGSAVITLALDVFSGIGGILGSVVGYVGGLILDLIFDKDPAAFATVAYDSTVGEMRVAGVTSVDGGNEAFAQAMARGFNGFLNGILDAAQAKNHNLGTVLATGTWSFGHSESNFRNGDGLNYTSADLALAKRLVDVIKSLDILDGDLKIAKVVDQVGALTGVTYQQALQELKMRIQIASDYQHYLENQGTIDALIAADPLSAFGVGWTQTFLQAAGYGLMDGVTRTGTAGDNVFLTGVGHDSIDGGAGSDRIEVYGGNDRVTGGAGNDLIFGGAGNDTLWGWYGDDKIYGGGGNDAVYGGLGLDTFLISEEAGRRLVDGGDGVDIISFAGDFNSNPSLSDYTLNWTSLTTVEVTNKDTGGVIVLTNVEFVRFRNTVRTLDTSYNAILGTIGNDLLTGTDLRDAINGLEGDDIIYGDAGDDFISGDAGADTLFGGQGNDWVFGVLGQDGVSGDAGNDYLSGGADDDAVWGNDGNDTLYGDDSQYGGNGDDVMVGGAGNDILLGGGYDDVLDGADGADTLFGGVGDDDLFGNTSNDMLEGEDGDDLIDGGDGNDSLVGGGGDDNIRSGNGTNIMFGDAAAGRTSGWGDDVLTGGTGSDTIFGGGGDDQAFGGDGNDCIYALPGSSWSSPFVFGNAGSGDGVSYYDEWGVDVSYGGAGNDLIGIGVGDVSFGGSGDDRFWVAAPQSRIDGGTGNDTVTITNYGLELVQWYRSASGRIAARVMNDNNNPPYQNDYIIVVDVETINHVTINRTYTFPSSGVIALTDTAFENAFGPAALLTRLQMSVWYYSDAEPPPISGWETFGSANDVINTSVLGSNGVRLFQTSGRQMIDTGEGNDSVSSGSGNDALRGGLGNDTLGGGGGGDVIEGGDGADSIDASTGNDTIVGGTGADWSDGKSGDDSTNGGTGNDSLSGGAGHDIVFGDEDNDNLNGWTGRDTVYGGAGTDGLWGGSSPDLLYGGDGNDQLYGDGGGDLMDGGLLNDTLFGGLGADKILGGVGDDQISGSEDRDDLGGGAGADSVWGGVGDDALSGGTESDSLDGGTGNDRLYGDDGNDTLHGNTGTDLIQGGNGNDVLMGSSDADQMDGGAGTDLANYTVSTSAVRILLSRGEGYGGLAHLDQLIGIENVTGSAYNDGLFGSVADNLFLGLAGNDTLFGDEGNDRLDGGDGNDAIDGGVGDDALFGQAGADALTGGTGNDRLEAGDGDDTAQGGLGSDSMLGGTGADWMDGGGDDDTLSGDAGIDSLTGGDGNDRLFGGDDDDALDGQAGSDSVVGGLGEDVLYGGDGNDTLTGDAGHDLLDGGQGDDALQGGDGNDILAGGVGNDTLTGAAGADVFVIAARDGLDTITDFQDAVDRIGLGVGQHRAVVFADTGGTRIQFAGEGSILLTGIAPASIAMVDFVIDPGSTLGLGTGILGTIAADTLAGGSGSDMIIGLDGNDRLTAGLGGDFAFGGNGGDTLYGGTVAATLYGGEGSDHFYSLGAADVISGGAGFDLARYDSSTVGVTIDLTRNLQSGGLAEGDVLSGIEGANGSAFADRITGNAFENRFTANGGDDLLRGMDGRDTLDGGAGNDTLFGGTGNDSLTGSTGDDLLDGGSGADSFVFTSGVMGNDRIVGFNGIGGDPTEGDVLVFQGLKVGTFVWRGAAAFTGGSDNSEARFVNGSVRVDTNGDGTLDIMFQIEGMTAASQLSASSFLWS